MPPKSQIQRAGNSGIEEGAVQYCYSLTPTEPVQGQCNEINKRITIFITLGCGQEVTSCCGDRELGAHQEDLDFVC